MPPYPCGMQPGDRLVLAYGEHDGPTRLKQHVRYGEVLADGAVRWESRFCPRLRRALAHHLHEPSNRARSTDPRM